MSHDHKNPRGANIWISVISLSFLLLSGCAGKIIKTDSAPDATPESLANGKKLYGTYCQSCHGDAGKGDGPMAASSNLKVADLTAAGRHITRFGLSVVIEKPHFSKFTIQRQIKYSSGQMPLVQEKMTKENMDDLSNYVLHLIHK
ncbi:MAG: cytochrome c [SAR324 cluster bacterium]|nr:cytochrome c [SAR324 cluster bacterium]